MKRSVIIFTALLLISCLAAKVYAHESQPGTLELRQIVKDRYEVTWRAPIYFGQPHPAHLELPETWKTVVRPAMRQLVDSQIFRSVILIETGNVEGCVIRFPGLEKTATDVFVRLNRLDGTTMTAVVRPTKPYVQLRGERKWTATAGEFISLGLNHILRGTDHLLFILGLLLIVKGRMSLIKTISAFTLAHSITLGLAALGVARVPIAPVDAVIALSILFLGPEIVRRWRGETSLTIRYPWIVVFLFGLLHGFGFSSGLSTAGMPRVEIPPALLFFNVGVELGQLAFVLTALALVKAFKVLEIRWPRWVEALPGYTVGSLGAFWTIQRAAILFGSLK